MTNPNRKLLLIGGGGHCRSVLDCALSLDLYNDIGIVSKERDAVLGIPFVGSDQDLSTLFQNGWTDAFITVGSIGNTAVRRRLYEMIRQIGFNLPSIVDNTAIVARGTQISEGCFVGKKAVVNTGASLGCCSIINTGAIVEHDCAVGDFCHISLGQLQMDADGAFLLLGIDDDWNLPSTAKTACVGASHLVTLGGCDADARAHGCVFRVVGDCLIRLEKECASL